MLIWKQMYGHKNITLYWKCQVIGWSVAALYWGYLGWGPNYTVELAILNFLSDVLIYILITHLYRLISKRYHWHLLEFKPLLIRLVPAMIVLGLAYMMATVAKLYLAHFLFVANFNEPFLHYYKLNSVRLFVAGVRLMSIWLLIYYLYHYAQRELRSLKENISLSEIAKEAKLNNLSAQLNPHFLFNSLNSIKGLVIENPEASRRAIDLLSDLLRRSLYGRDSMLISVEEELSIVNDYLELEKMRFEERLQFEVQVAERTLSSLIIPFCVQTLVENAVKHGINKRSEGGIIKIFIAQVEDSICVKVENTGNLSREIKTKGLGLKNLKERLKLQFDEKATFHIINNSDETVMATIFMPAA